MDEALEYLRACIEKAEFMPYPWDGEDKNLWAFRSKALFAAWYCQPPGTEGQPYRDRAFYTRELAYLSQLIRPKTIVELGTSLGIGTCLLSWLNPKAKLITVDLNTETFLPGDRRVRMGHLARWQQIQCEYITMPSWHYERPDVDLCFIDAEHTYESVVKDSMAAWYNRSRSKRWAICWHDYNTRHPGVMHAVREFCDYKQLQLQSRPDSDTVWVTGEV